MGSFIEFFYSENGDDVLFLFDDEEICKIKKECRKALSKSISIRFSSLLVSYFKKGQMLFDYCDSKWLEQDTKNEIQAITREHLSEIDTVMDLFTAYKCNLLTVEQYLNRYCDLTEDYDVEQFAREFNYTHAYDYCYPEEIQWYILSKIIVLIGYKSLDSFNYVKLGPFKKTKCVRDLLVWIKDLETSNIIYTSIMKRAEDLICSVLNADEKWTLYEENLISSPGLERN